MNHPPFRSRALRLLAILAVTFLALGLRLRAVNRLPIDYDEDDYLAAGQRYAAALRAGDWDRLINYDFNSEHPPLTKLVYGVSILSLPPGFEIPERPSTDPPARVLPRPHFTYTRLTAATAGTLEVLVVALLNPLAALFLGIHTWQIKYTSQIMLEPLPSFTSAVMVLAYVKWRMGNGQRRNGWLALSGVMLGLTAASKYTYCIAAFAIITDWLRATFPARPRTAATWARWLAPVFGWGLLSIVVFVAFDPRMWSHGLERLWQSVVYHASYAESQHVKDAGYPMWQPLVWLSGPVPWHPGVFVFLLDLPISLLALLGVRRLWRTPGQRVMALWLMLTLAFLLWWNTKWPQYILMLTVPLTVAAAEGFKGYVAEPVAAWFQRVRAPSTSLRAASRSTPLGQGARRALPWLLPGLLALALITLFPLIYQAAMALTDFNAISIRDGINGGVWRAVWQGLTGQVEPVDFSIGRLFERLPNNREVHFAGPRVLLELFSGVASEILLFNVLWTALSVALQTALGVSAALLLHRRGVSFRGGWRAVFILPWAIPEYIGAIIWLRLFDPVSGWVNLAVSASSGGVASANPLQDTSSALVILLMAALWYGFPLVMLVATAGLEQVPAEVYDAAAMDGAGGWAQFRHITWPMLWPLLAPAVLIRAIFAFNQFYLFYVLQPPGAMITFATVSYYVFNPTGRFGGWFSISAAINVFTVMVLMALVIWLGRASKAAEGVTYA